MNTRYRYIHNSVKLVLALRIFKFTDRKFYYGEMLKETPWQLQVHAEPIGYIEQLQNKISYPFYGVDLDCLWIIIAPNHYQITLEFSQLDIEGQYPCPFDYIQVGTSHVDILVGFIRSRVVKSLAYREPTRSDKNLAGQH